MIGVFQQLRETCKVLVIRTEQMAVFRRHALEDFRASIARSLRVAFREQIVHCTDANLDALIWAAIDKANSYGVTRPLDVARFIEYYVCLGAQLDTDEGMRWAGDILRCTHLDGGTKVTMLDRGDRANRSPTRDEIVARNLQSAGRR